MLEVVEKLFGTSDLFKVLNISSEKAGDEKQLRSAYLKSALLFHPDKCSDKESTEKFQVIQKIYELLKDDDLRKVYEDTGAWPEDEQFTLDDASLGRIDAHAISEFKKMYIGSEEEQNDIIRLYNEGEGDIFHIIDKLFFANILTDESRIESIINDLISKDKVEQKTKGVRSQKYRDRKMKQAKKEAKEAEETLKQLGIGSSMDSLQQAIAKRSAQRMDSFIDELEKKYGGSGKTNTKRKGSKPQADDASTPAKKSKNLQAASSSSSKSKRKRK